MGALGALLDQPGSGLPTEQDAKLATESSRILSQTDGAETAGEFRVRLAGGEELRLPSAVRTLLIHLLTEMSKGNAVTIIPIHAELTTQEAAEFLNVSRPHLISLLERAEMPFHMAGTHRRIKCSDLAAYKERKEREREDAMRELAEQAQELDMGY